MLTPLPVRFSSSTNFNNKTPRVPQNPDTASGKYKKTLLSPSKDLRSSKLTDSEPIEFIADEPKPVKPDFTLKTPHSKQLQKLWKQYNKALVEYREQQKKSGAKQTNPKIQAEQKMLNPKIILWNESAQKLQDNYAQNIKIHEVIERDLILTLQKHTKTIKAQKPFFWPLVKRLGITYLTLWATGKAVHRAAHTDTGKVVGECLFDAPSAGCFSPVQDLFNPTVYPPFNTWDMFRPASPPSQVIMDVQEWATPLGIPSSFTRHLFKPNNRPTEDADHLIRLTNWMAHHRNEEDLQKTEKFFKKLLRQYQLQYHPDKQHGLSKQEHQQYEVEFRDGFHKLEANYQRFLKLNLSRFKADILADAKDCGKQFADITNQALEANNAIDAAEKITDFDNLRLAPWQFSNILKARNIDQEKTDELYQKLKDWYDVRHKPDIKLLWVSPEQYYQQLDEYLIGLAKIDWSYGW